MVLVGNKAKRLSSVNHTTKTIHHLLHHQTVGFFAKVYICALGQNCTSNFLVQRCRSETYLDNIDLTIFLCNVVPV